MIDFSSHTRHGGHRRTLRPARQGAWSSAPPATPTRRNHASRSHASRIPMVLASNYSTGVNTLFWLTRKAAEILGPAFDLEVVEMHHRLKKDAPSGTAKIAGGDSGRRSPAATRRRSRGTVAKASWANAQPRKSASTPCAAAMSWAITPSFSPPNGERRRTHPQSLESRHLRQRRLARRRVGGETEARPLRHAGCAGVGVGQASRRSQFFPCAILLENLKMESGATPDLRR